MSVAKWIEFVFLLLGLDAFVIFVAVAIPLAFRYIVRFWVVEFVVRIREDAMELGPEKDGVVRERCSPTRSG